MHTHVMLSLALVASMTGCKKQEAVPRTDPALAPGSAAGSGSAATVAAGSGSATNPVGSDAPTAPTTNAGGSGSATCATVELTLAQAGVIVKREATATPMKLDALEPALRALAKTCLGAATVRADDDVSYQAIITVMDTAMKVGFVDLAVAGPEGKRAAPKGPNVARELKPVPGDPAAGMKDMPIVIVTQTEITIGATKLPVAKVEAKQLDTALKAMPHSKGYPNTVVLQADQATSGKTINLVIAAAEGAGFTDVLFAVKNK